MTGSFARNESQPDFLTVPLIRLHVAKTVLQKVGLMSIFETLEYIYTPAPVIEESIRFYQNVLGGSLLWKVRDGQTVVACVRLSEKEPLILLANHLKNGTPIFIYRVKDLDATVSALRSRGCTFESGPFELPQGPCYRFCDPQKMQFAIFQQVRTEADKHFEGRFDD
jgi:predicted enzyme related to lactoylglutathione lyase